MHKTTLFSSILLLVLILITPALFTDPIDEKWENSKIIIQLPEPSYWGNISVEESLLRRRSIRSYRDEPLSLKDISQLLWAAQGITDHNRTAPSAGALYPLELYVVVSKVQNLNAGVYKYLPREHSLRKIKDGDFRKELSCAALRQSCIENGSVDLIFCAVYQRTTRKYGNRGKRYVHMEVGFAAENVYLQAVSINLGTFMVGAFSDEKVKELLNLPAKEGPWVLCRWASRFRFQMKGGRHPPCFCRYGFQWCSSL